MSPKKIKWEKGRFKGIRFYKHEYRKHGVKFDRYFSGSYQVQGKRKFMGFGWESEGWTESQVRDKIREYKHNVKTGQRPSTLKEEIALKEAEEKRLRNEAKKEAARNVSFKDFFNDVYKPVAKTNKKPESWRKEQEHFNNWLKPEIGHLPIKKITPFNLEKIKGKMLDKRRAPRSIQYVFATFRQIWNYAKVNSIITEESPTKKVKLPKIENKRVRFFSHEEADKILVELKKKSQQIHDMTLLSLHTGVRAGEIFSMTWGVVDLNNGSIQIRDAKGKPRYVYLTEATKKMLKEQQNDQKSTELVFKDRIGKQITSISNSFDRVIEDLGLNEDVTDRRDRVTFHTCRHTFASWHVQNGTDLYTVKELLGHSTIQLTERYSHLRPDGLKKAAQNFDEKVLKNNIVSFENAETGEINGS